MSGNEDSSSYGTGRIPLQRAQRYSSTHPKSVSEPRLQPTTIECDGSQSVEWRSRYLKDEIETPLDKGDPSRGPAIIKALSKAIRHENHERFSVLLKRCGPLALCTGKTNCRNASDPTRHGVRCTIANAVIEEIVSCSVDCSGFVQILIETGLDLRGSHETIDGRRLWFWAALKDHANLVAYMITAGFPIDQGLLLSDRSTLAYALPPNSDPLPHGITALFAALITNAYMVALDLIKHGATLRLHFHEQSDVYTVSAYVDGHEDGDEPIVVDAMMVLAPRFTKTHPSQQDDVYLEVVKQLLSLGLNPNLPSNLWIKASSIFFMSLSQGRPSHQYVQEISFVLKVALYGHVEVMKILVESGADINAKGFHGQSLLHFAIRSTKLDMVEYVAELTEEIDVQDDFGYSPLHHAVALDLPEIAESLLEYDADVDHVSKAGLSPLHLAVSLKNTEMCELLLQYDAEVNTRLTSAVTKRSFNHAVDWYDLTSTEMVFGSTPLLSALCPDKMVYLLPVVSDSDSETGSTDDDSSTTHSGGELADLSFNTTDESLSVGTLGRRISKVNSGQPDEIRNRLINLLLRSGARACEMGYIFKKRLDLVNKDRDRDWEWSPFAYEVERCFPLSLACKTTTEAWSLYSKTSIRNVRGTSNVVRTILTAAGPELTPHMLDEALAAACFTRVRMDCGTRGDGQFRLSRSTIEMLLDEGADPNQRNDQHFTLLHLSCVPWYEGQDQSDLTDRLLRNGAYIEARCPRNRTPLHWAAAWNFNAMKVLLDHGADTFIHDDSNRDPLHYACSNPVSRLDSHGVRLLLQHPHPKESLSWDQTRLALACDNQWSQEDCKILHQLIDPGNPQHTNAAIHVACMRGCIKSLAAICTHSQPWQSYTLRDQQGATPLIKAVKTDSPKILSLILQGIRIANFDPERGSDGMYCQIDDVLVEQRSIDSRSIYGRQRSTQDQGATEKQYQQSTRVDGSHGLIDPSLQVDNPLFNEQYFRKEQGIPHGRQGTSLEIMALGQKPRTSCLNARDHIGWTALHYAAAIGNVKIMRLLLSEPDINLEPSSDLCKTPLEILRASEKQELIESYSEALRSHNPGLKSNRAQIVGSSRRARLMNGEMLLTFRAKSWLEREYVKFQRMVGSQDYQLILFLLAVVWATWRLSSVSEETRTS